MNFFTHQEQALKRTVLLVILFVLAIAILIGSLNFLIAYFLLRDPNSERSVLDTVPVAQWVYLSLGGIGIIGLASLYRWFGLLDGGRAVAESLGGRLLPPNSQDFYERRLLNVVEEIALAASTPVPPVYVLDEEGINAFAAGYKASDAVIGVTKGCMMKLSRDQLQGVIAHEFSHIFNGDMRLNIRLMAVLFGILFIGLIGRFIFEVAAKSSRRSSKKNDGAGAFLIIGLGFIVIGYCGVFFGNLIKAAVSRQREYLADASAVQFTRNPEGIAGALQVIGYGAQKSYLQNPNCEEASHLFFGQALRMGMMGVFDTHPPLEKRILRINPRWKGNFLPPQTLEKAQQEAKNISSFADHAAPILAATLAAVETTATTNTTQESIAFEHKNLSIARDPAKAPALMCALLLQSKAPSERDLALEMLALAPQQALFKDVPNLLIEAQFIADDLRMTLVDIAMPALKQMSALDYKVFREMLENLLTSNVRPTLFDWCLVRLLHGYLDAQFSRPNRKNDLLPNSERTDKKIGVLLSVIANHGHATQESALAAFEQGCLAGGFNQLTHYGRVYAQDLGDSFSQLRNLMPHVKGRLLKAMYAVVQYDGQINTAESDLIKTMAAILEMPSIVDGN